MTSIKGPRVTLTFGDLISLCIYLVSRIRSDDRIVDIKLDYQSRGRKIDPFFSGLLDESLN